ncbi:MAG: peroxidase family protein [Rhizonema sp. NSF051]|nr:peroxidase family protein [Rhizonema sp. NSF051]
MSILEVERVPYTDGTLFLGDKGVSLRTNNGTQNNLNKPSLGAANTPFIRLAPIRFEDGIQLPTGVAFDAEGNPLIGIDIFSRGERPGERPFAPTRQPAPIFSGAEKEGVGFVGGDERVSENDSLTAEQTLWMRNHDRIAHKLSQFHSHTVSFYQVGDRNGTVVYPIIDKSLSSNQIPDYAKAAIGKSVAEFRVNNNLNTLNFNINLSGRTILSPYIIQNASKDDFEKGYAQAFFAFTTAYQDGLSHVHVPKERQHLHIWL